MDVARFVPHLGQNSVTNKTVSDSPITTCSHKTWPQHMPTRVAYLSRQTTAALVAQALQARHPLTLMCSAEEEEGPHPTAQLATWVALAEPSDQRKAEQVQGVQERAFEEVGAREA